MATKTGSISYRGRTINRYHGSPPGARYLSERTFYKVAGLRKPDHFDTLEDAKEWVRVWTNKEQSKDEVRRHFKITVKRKR